MTGRFDLTGVRASSPESGGAAHGTTAADLLDLLLSRPAWMADAACREHPELDFFPSRGQTRLTDLRDVCRGCLVRTECLDFSIDSREMFGVWGGLSERERRKVRQLRNRERREEEARARWETGDDTEQVA